MNDLVIIFGFLGIAYYIYQDPKHLEIEKYKYQVALIIIIFFMYYVTGSNELIEGFPKCYSICFGLDQKKCKQGQGVCDWVKEKSFCKITDRKKNKDGTNPDECAKGEHSKKKDKCEGYDICQWLSQKEWGDIQKKQQQQGQQQKKQQQQGQQQQKKQSGGKKGKHPKGNNGKDAACTALDWYRSSPDWGKTAKKWYDGKLIDGSVSDKCKKCSGGGNVEPCLAEYPDADTAKGKCPATCSKPASWPRDNCDDVKKFPGAYKGCNGDKKCQARKVVELPATCSSCVIKAQNKAGYKWIKCFGREEEAGQGQQGGGSGGGGSGSAAESARNIGRSGGGNKTSCDLWCKFWWGVGIAAIAVLIAVATWFFYVKGRW